MSKESSKIKEIDGRENPILLTSEESSYEVPCRFDKDPHIPYLEI
ncbi:MAG TPA: hypothetical protein VKA09_14060 [Nitrososphaeraceae archaeon]|nr:hypothetical protein [Nitrososphaeraceae archaeon]